MANLGECVDLDFKLGIVGSHLGILLGRRMYEEVTTLAILVMSSLVRRLEVDGA